MVSPKQLLSTIESALLGSSPPTPAQRIELMHAIRKSLSSLQSLLSYPVPPHSPNHFIQFQYSFEFGYFSVPSFLFCYFDCVGNVAVAYLVTSVVLLIHCLLIVEIFGVVSLRNPRTGHKCSQGKLGFRIRRQSHLTIRMFGL